MLRASGLGCERENQILFSDLTFNIEPGMLALVRGKNGSGKSSLLKILAGLCPATSGSVLWQGAPIQANDPGFLSNLLYIGHKLGLQPVLSPLENLKWLLGLKARNSDEEATGDRGHSLPSLLEVLQSLGLLGVENLPCEVLSRGQCQRLALARLWLRPPKCWILDEPFTALDDSGKTLLLKRFEEHLSKGGVIVLASHTSLDFNFPRIEELYLGSV